MNDNKMYRLAIHLLSIALVLLAFNITTGTTSYAASAKSDKAFQKWVKRVKAKARRKGIKSGVLKAAFKQVPSPDPEVFKRANNQAEFKKPIWEYMERRVRESRVKQGRELLKKHAKLLKAVEKKYGVDRHIVLAIWGLESNFGSHPGDKNVIRSLATLAYKGRRKRFGRSQLYAALKILQRGDVKPEAMKGSWAGAMGHTQFIPTTYNAYAVDFDRDGRRDIWSTIPDALGSTANYLRVSRWRSGKTWGYEVKLPAKFNRRLAKGRTRKSIAQWKKLGVRRVNGKEFPRVSDKARLHTPAGAKGPAFLILPNFRSILRYNNSFAYALSVGHLADRLRGGGKFVTPWPVKLKKSALSFEQTEELQRALIGAGYDLGNVDGLLGEKTVAAIKAYQENNGLSVDGNATPQLLGRLKKQKPVQ